MAREYCQALAAMNVSDVTVITRSRESADRVKTWFPVQVLAGGYEGCLTPASRFDLTVVATPIPSLRAAATWAIDSGARNVLVEKPAALYSSELSEWAAAADGRSRVRVAYNRLMYPSVWKARSMIAEAGSQITSARYTFTEWTHELAGKASAGDSVYTRWGISNSLHLIGLAHALIGQPKELVAFKDGGLEWHPSGSRFTGAGTTQTGVVFSYQADWTSAGRWSLELMTPIGAYQFMPLEALAVRSKTSIQWENVPLLQPFAGVKPGVAEQLAVMLTPELEASFELVTLDHAAALTAFAERMLGYSDKA